MSASTHLVEVNTDDLRCSTGFDGGAKCGHFHEYRSRSLLFGTTIETPVCGLFGRELKRYESERLPVVARCDLCLESFGTSEREAKFERFDVPVHHLTERPRRDTDPAPPPVARSFAHPNLRAVDRPTLGHAKR